LAAMIGPTKRKLESAVIFMAIQYTFQRVEKKYFLTPAQYEMLRPVLEKHTKPDEFGPSTVYSLYCDTDDYGLIRHSEGRPVYKEKLRLRSYGVPGENDSVFLELKKKYKGVVFKRRISLPLHEARTYLETGQHPDGENQIFQEIDWFIRTNRPQPKALIACDRVALVGREDPCLRLTFDRHIRFRRTELDLSLGDRDMQILEPDLILMEVKASGAVPVWLSHLLSQLQIFPTTFSKYGACYKNYLLPTYFERTVNSYV